MSSPATPRAVVFSVCAVPAATLLTELLVSRFFSVLFYYHYSFFAVSIVMTGITIGGLLSAQFLRKDDDRQVASHLAGSACLFSLLLMAATTFLLWFTPRIDFLKPTWGEIALLALAYLPALTASGCFLASVFSRYAKDVSRLYAYDLAFAALGVGGAVWMMRIWQGPVAMFIPAVLASLAALALGWQRLHWRVLSGAALTIAAVVTAMPFWSGRSVPLVLPPSFEVWDGGDPNIRSEQWNEHSRILVAGLDEHNILPIFIDKQAMTTFTHLPWREPGAPPPVHPWMTQDPSASVYMLPRAHDRVAIIGVGGGRDILCAVASGAKEVHGYELNGILTNLLDNEYLRYTGGLARWPEVKLIHDEARVGIQRSGVQYDVIVASMIDTWAATANGGFVLSENGLYTIEAWKQFLESLAPGGVLAMTRWYLPAEPAEAQRLTVLAARSLEEAGITDPSRHMIVSTTAVAAASSEGELFATIYVSLTPFTPEEIAEFTRRIASVPDAQVLLFPGGDRTLARLVDRETRAAAIAESPWDISATTDEKPYFFLQIRPTDITKLFATEDRTGIRMVTFNGVRVLVTMTVLSLVFAALIMAWTFLAFRGGEGTESWRGRRMGVYFFGIGIGYILVQLGLLQRLIIVLGHPTYAFTVILFTMLLSTGAGAALSNRFPDRRVPLAWGLVLAVIGLIVVAFPLFAALDGVHGKVLRLVLAGLPPSMAGLVLGFCFPIGVRLVEAAGPSAVQRMWAINGAASVAGSGAAAFLSLLGGSRLVILAGLLCYAMVFLAGWGTWKRTRQVERP